MRYLHIGTISEGTMHSDQIGEALIIDMRRLRMSKRDRQAFRKLCREFSKLTEMDRDDMSAEQVEELDEVVDDLRTLAEGYTPPLCYLGATEGDGACLGVWPDADVLNSTHDDEDLGITRVSDTGDVPKGHTGLVLHVNDHGNATLYQATRGRLRVAWCLV